MSKIEWRRPQDQIFEAGLDRGVLYPDEGVAVAWNGLISVDDNGDAVIKNFYLDGVKYLSTASARDWKGTLSAFTYPEEFSELVGLSELADGLHADSQLPGRFGLSYRTMITAADYDQKQYYKIHLVYNLIATFSAFANNTLTGTIDPNEFKFNLSAVPILVPQRRPTAHFIIDTRKVNDSILLELENIIYGTEIVDPAMPTIEELISLLQFTGGVVVVYNGDGTWTATGSEDDIRMFDYDTRFRIDNVAATYLEPGLVYQFDDAIGTLIILLDDDDVPFIAVGDDGYTVFTDVDSIYYFDNVGVSVLEILEDEDAIYYIDGP